MTEQSAIPTPCKAICRLGPDQVCDGCGRTIAEIVTWAQLPPAVRTRVLARVAAWRPREEAGEERR